jgi:ribosome-associated protein
LRDDTNSRPAVSSSDPSLTSALRTLLSRKAQRLVVLRLGERAYYTDFFVICHGTSERQVKSLAEEVVERVKRETGARASIEGLAHAEWVLLDFGDFVVHVFSEAAREFYRLESLWFDAESIDPEQLAVAVDG